MIDLRYYLNAIVLRITRKQSSIFIIDNEIGSIIVIYFRIIIYITLLLPTSFTSRVNY